MDSSLKHKIQNLLDVHGDHKKFLHQVLSVLLCFHCCINTCKKQFHFYKISKYLLCVEKNRKQLFLNKFWLIGSTHLKGRSMSKQAMVTLQEIAVLNNLYGS